ncbi:MAG: WHG domain-containing protein [Methylococcales bacterium]
MARRSEHTQEEIKQMVIQAAETIINEDGSAKLKARTLAMEIGYTVGSIYMVFNNMADLILHLKARTLDDIGLFLQQVPAHNPPHDCLIALSKAYLHYAKRHFNRWQMLFEQGETAGAVVPEWYALKIAELLNPVASHFKRLAPQAPAEQIQQAAQALWQGVQGICLLSLSDPLDELEVREIEAIIVLLVDNFIRGWMISYPEQ